MKDTINFRVGEDERKIVEAVKKYFNAEYGLSLNDSEVMRMALKELNQTMKKKGDGV